MARPPAVIPSRPLNLSFPEDLRARLDLVLFSSVEGCVPQGAYKEFFSARTREFFAWRRLDLAPYGLPPGFFVSGPPEMLDALRARLSTTTSEPSV